MRKITEMKKIIFIVVLTVIKTASFAQSPNEKQDSLIYFDSEASSFEIPQWENDEDFEYCYKIVEVNYIVKGIDLDSSEYYIAKYITTTKSCMGYENSNKNIKIELRAFDNPQKSVLNIEKNCDKITLGFQTYKTTIYGCCEMPDYFEVFNYKHKSIIQAHNKIIIGSIPQSHIEIYIGYKHELKDKSFLGTLYISYSSGEKYEVRVKSKGKTSYNYYLFSPQINILTENDKSEYQYISEQFKWISEFEREITYDIWSLKGIKDEHQINGVKILLEYDRDNHTDISSIEIPIINGKPFGKDIKIQEVEIIF